MLKAIIFDMDGTLADTEDIHRIAFNQAFAEFKLSWEWSVAEYKELLAISGGKERIRNYFQLKETIPEENTDLWHFAESIHKRKSDIYRDRLIAGHIQLRPGVKRLIDDAIENKIILSIATSSSQKNVETLLKNALGENAMSIFSVVVTSDTVEDKKPSPAVYQMVLSELGLSAENCIAIEDTYNGNRAANSANLKTVITTHLYTHDDDFSNASLVVDQLGENENPFTVSFGDAFGKKMVDVELLQEICNNETQSLDSEQWRQSEPVTVAN
jgi:HAD superfamily hydrolase (TIGR01509 family)